MIVIKCNSEQDLMREFTLRDAFNPEDKYLYASELIRQDYWYKQSEETERTGYILRY